MRRATTTSLRCSMRPDGKPLALGFADLFDHLGTDALRYSAAARELSGREVAIAGFLSHPHGPRGALHAGRPARPLSRLLAGSGRGNRAPRRGGFPPAGEEREVRVVGRLDYGFRIDDGIASMLRIEAARVRPARGLSVKQLIHGGRLLTAGRLDGELRRRADRRRHHRRRAGAGRERQRRRKAHRRHRPAADPRPDQRPHPRDRGARPRGLPTAGRSRLLLNAYPWTAGGRTLEHKYLSAKIGALEMVRKGCTACYDLAVEFPAPSVEGIDAVARAYQDVGMRAVIAPMMADRRSTRRSPG